MTTQTISTLANRSEGQLDDMIAKAEAWIAAPDRHSPQQLELARNTIAAIAAERVRRHQAVWAEQSSRDPGARAAAAFAHRPIDRHERRFLSILVDTDWIASDELASRLGWKGGIGPLGSIVSDRLAFFGPPDANERGSDPHLLHLVERREEENRTVIRLRRDVLDAVTAAIRDHDLEIERKRRIGRR